MSHKQCLQNNQLQSFTQKTLHLILNRKAKLKQLSTQQLEDYYQGLCLFYQGSFLEYKSYIIQQLKNRRKDSSKGIQMIVNEQTQTFNMKADYRVQQDTICDTIKDSAKYNRSEAQTTQKSHFVVQNNAQKQVSNKKNERKIIMKQSQKIDNLLPKQQQDISVFTNHDNNSKKKAANQYYLIFNNLKGQQRYVNYDQLVQLFKQKPQQLSYILNPNLIPSQKLPQNILQTNNNYKNRSWQQLATMIMYYIDRSAYSKWFIDPVDSSLQGLQNYYEIIEQPRCLKQIRLKLYFNYYKNHQKFSEDIQLMIDNSIRFNGEHSEVGEAAKRIRKIFYHNYNRMILQNPFMIKERKI